MSSGAGMNGLTVVDCFAGPGGWDVGAVELGLDPLGIEWDDAACRVREAAGLRTLQADVAALDPEDFPCDLLIASPPCTAFSMAGKGEGRRALDTLLAAVRSMGDGEEIDHAALDEACSDETAHLVLEPLRWALAIKPRLVCCEQVPPALPVWEAMEPILRARGYSTWSGVLSAEQFGIVVTCPEHDPQPVHIAGLPSCPTSLATADPAATPWVAWQESVETAERRSTFSTALASVHHVATGNAIGEHGTEALSDAWTVASLARVVLDDASDATWHSLVLDLLRRALPARRTPRGRVGAEWTNAAISASGWTGATGANIAWSPSSFWGELCALARSYITSMETSPTTHPTTSGCSPTTALTRTSTTQARSRSECSLCDDLATPQTRKRAFLIASLDGPVSMPAPTHQRYVAPRSRDDEGGGLFDLPEPARIVAPGDAHLLPWVSMAEALGWGMTARPSVTVVSRSSSQGSPDPLDGGSGARRLLREAQGAGRWVMRANANANATVRDVDEPAPTITAGHDSGDRVWKPFAMRKAPYGEGMIERHGDREPVEVDRPAPAITSKARSAEWVGERPAPTIVTTRRSDEGVLVGRQLPPGEGRNVGGRDWIDGRPATTLAGDQRVFQPGGHHTPGAQSQNAVRVSIEQAACLQSFPAGYPWEAAGSRSAAFRCIGNAVPPLLARAVLAEALASSVEVGVAV